MKKEIAMELPQLNQKQLQQAAQEAAMKGALEEVKNYYSGYNSSFRKAIREDLESKSVNVHLELPDIVELIKSSLSQEMTKIANETITESFLPMVKSLNRLPKGVEFSELLEKFCSASGKNEWNDNEPTCIIEEDSQFKWLRVELKYESYEAYFTLHKEGDKYQLLSMPSPKKYGSEIGPNLVIKNGDTTIKFPFCASPLSDDFYTYCVNLIISKSKITMDREEFEPSDWG